MAAVIRRLQVRSTLKRAFLHGCKAGGAFRVAQYLLRNRLLILCFHGFQLVDEAAFRPQLFMRESTLIHRLQTIRAHRCKVLRLADALAMLRADALPVNAICLTIDDGFFSTLRVAAPILKSFGYPATLYLTSYYSREQAPIFRLVVQYMFWKTPRTALPVTEDPWATGQAVNLSNANDKNAICWRIISYGESREKESERESISRRLGEILDVDYVGLARSRMLNIVSASEIAELTEYNLDVQLHTHRHRLPLDDGDEVRREIRENRSYIASVTGSMPRHLCYPSGRWAPQQWKWLEEEGVLSAVTCDPGFNNASTPPLGLMRFLDQDDLSGVEYEAELSGWMEILRGTAAGRFVRRRRAVT